MWLCLADEYLGITQQMDGPPSPFLLFQREFCQKIDFLQEEPKRQHTKRERGKKRL